MLRKTTLVISICCVLSACSHTSSSKQTKVNETSKKSQLTCSSPAPNSVTTQLYFGLSKQDGSEVSETEWNGFFNSILVPEFTGLSTLSSQGAWLNTETNTVGTEASRLVIIVAEQNNDHLESINKAIKNYVTTFNQQSVLVNTFPSNPRFCGISTK